MALVIRHMSSAQQVIDAQLSTDRKRKKASERLSSGYRINRAADDAAGLAVSEKLRSIRRGLKQGLRNIDDGINYVRTVEGASQEIHNMLHRLKELAVESCNGTYSELDRDAMDLEYQQILDEIDQLTGTADFNGVPLFEKHLSAFEMNEGDVVHSSPVKINAKNDTLLLGYTIDGVQKEYTVNIPRGTYSVEELADLIDTDLFENAPELIIGVNTQDQLTMQAEGGSIDYISGSASSLFYNTVIGSSDGYLLGVTFFRRDTTTLEVQAGKNDTFSFRVGNTDDTLHTFTLDPGRYTCDQLIDAINNKIAAAGIPGNIKAVPCENENGDRVIGLSSDSTITGLAGNFIEIDGIDSPIYDICKYVNIDNSQAVLAGTKRIPDTLKIERGRNEYFVLDLKWYGDDASAQSTRLRIDLLADGENVKTTSPMELVHAVQKQLDDAAVPFTVTLNSNGGLNIESDQYGNKCAVDLVESDSPSPYMVYDLFDASTLVQVKPSQGTSTYTRAIFTAYKQLTAPIYIPASENTLSFNITLSDDNQAPASEKTVERLDIVIPAGSYTSTSALVQAMNDQIDNNYPDLADKLQFSIDTSDAIKLYAEGNNGSDVEKIEIDTACSAYKRLIAGTKYHDNISIKKGEETAYETSSTNVPGSSRNNVTSTSGSTQQGVTYVKEQSPPDPQESSPYITYSEATKNIVDGTTTRIYEEGDPDGKITATSPATLTLNDVLTQFKVPGASQKDITFSFTLEGKNGPEDRSVFIPEGSNADEAVAMIRDEIKDLASLKVNGNSITITSIEKGEEMKFYNVSGTLLNKASKSSLASQSGAVIDEANNMVYVPSTLTVKNAASQIPYTVDASSDRLIMTAGQHSYDLRLSHKTYTSLAEMAAEINAQISAADGGTPATTVKVGSDGKSLIFTGPYSESGTVALDDVSTCKIGFTKKTVNTSDPYYNPATGDIERPASMRAEGIDTHFPKIIDSANNTITMDYTSPDPQDANKTVTEKLTITIPDGTYNNASEFTNAINNAIASDPSLNGKIKASYSDSGSNKGLTFTTVNGGSGYKLTNLGGTSEVDKYISKANTSGGELDADGNVVRFPAYALNDKYNTLFSGDGVEITDANDHVSIVINGTTYEFDIAHGVYQGSSGRADLTDQLRDGLAGADVTIEDSGDTLKITTNDSGLGKNIAINGGNTAPCFKRAEPVKSPTTNQRQESPCYIIGENDISDIEIKDYFNSMTFDYVQDGKTYQVDVTVPVGTYTAQTLAQAIQNSINQTLPANSLEVYTNNSGNIGIRSATITPLRTIRNFEGGLFDKVFQNANYTNVRFHSETPGESSDSFLTYIIGRNDLSPETSEEISSGHNVIIYPALNDNLVFDLRYDGETYKVDLTIPAGEYTPKQLAEAVRDAGRTALNGMTDKNGKPFPEDAFNATIGLTPIGLPDPNTAIKSSDKLVLSFKVPDDGSINDTKCIIDGVRGSAAYRIFYEATQSPTPSKVIGKADLTNGIMITAGENDTLTFELDGVTTSVTIPEDTYTCDEMYRYLNEQYAAANSMVRCTNMSGHLMFYTIENGDYVIGKFTGNAADDLFYGGESRETDSEIGIHTGRRTDTYIWYLKTRVDDHLLRINTTGVSTAERSAKALSRIDDAVNSLSYWRALSGANENRSRHTYSRNQEYVENIEEADSTLRDADIPTEAAELAKQQILIQAQNAMLEQSKQQHSSILDVLA